MEGQGATATEQVHTAMGLEMIIFIDFLFSLVFPICT